MTFEEVAERCRKHGVTGEITIYESGYQVVVIDASFFWQREKLFDTLDQATQYLHSSAKQLYPDTYGKEEA